MHCYFTSYFLPLIIILLRQTYQMKNELLVSKAYFNQFIEMKETIPLKVRHKLKINNLDNIKINSKKLPPDFFRPYTRENLINLPPERDTNVKTPCFGDEKKESYSLSLIPRERNNLQLQHQRVTTLPVQQLDPLEVRGFTRKNCTRQLQRKDKPNSHRLSSNRHDIDNRDSTSRQKIKYKKLTLNDEVNGDQKKAINFEYQNRIRLNIKKFFEDQHQFNNKQINSKTGRKNVGSIQKIVDQSGIRTKARRLPPLP